MLSDQEQTYYKRQVSLNQFGLTAQLKLKNAKVLVIGAGGLGCPALQYLTGVGVGKIGIVDGDQVNEHNLHRQILFDIQAIGQNKALAAKTILEKHNPYITIETFPEFLDLENATRITENYDLVLDCSDNFETRYLINDVCELLDKPFVYGSIYRYEGQICVFNFQNGPSYRCLFPDVSENSNVLNCNDDGVIGVLPGIIGLYQAIEAIKLITGIGEIRNGALTLINVLTNQTTTVTIERKDIPYKEQLVKFGLSTYNTSCQKKPTNILEISDLALLNDYLIVDVRNLNEEPRIALENVLEIPLDELESNLKLVSEFKNIVCVCKSGKRSLKATQILENKIPGKVYSLKNGLTNEFINSWKNEKQTT